MGFKSFLEKKKQARKESIAFSNIVKKRTLQARRQEYEKEAITQARKQGKQIAISKANKPTFGQRLANIATKVADKATAPSPVRKANIKRSVRRTRTKVRKIKRKPVAVVRRKVRPVRRQVARPVAAQPRSTGADLGIY